MATCMRLVKNVPLHLQNVKQYLPDQAVRLFSTSWSQCLDQRWRREKKLPQNPNACGPLTSQPDYSYPTGKTVPVGARMYKRLQKQKEYAEKIVTLCKELDFALEWDKQLKLEEENKKQKIIDNKLKRKGHLLLKK